MANFPKVDLRVTNNGEWNQVVDTVAITVPSSSPYTVTLPEVPDDGYVNDKIAIPGLTEGGYYQFNPSSGVWTSYGTYPPVSGEFYTNYSTGVIEFNEDEQGQTFNVTYWKKGSLIQAEDLNDLNDRLEAVTDSTSSVSLDILSDTDLASTSPEEGDVLIYDGNNWVPSQTSNILNLTLYPSDDEPVLTKDGQIILWKDTNDSDKIYLVVRRGAGDQVKIELTN